MKTTRRGFFARLGGVLAAVVVPWRVYKFHVDAHGDRPKRFVVGYDPAYGDKSVMTIMGYDEHGKLRIERLEVPGITKHSYRRMA